MKSAHAVTGEVLARGILRCKSGALILSPSVRAARFAMAGLILVRRKAQKEQISVDSEEDFGIEGARSPSHPAELPWPPALRNYPEHSPGRRNEQSKAPFNEEWAQADFGAEFVSELKRFNGKFCGDWWQLAFLIRHSEADENSFSEERFKHWNDRFNLSARYIHLEFANLRNADLEGAHANFAHAHLEHVILCGAHLQHASFRRAKLFSANLCTANLADADLREGDMRNTQLKEAVLDRTDVRGAFGLRFDDNSVDRLRIDGDAPDPWSVLRRTYTGPRFFLNLLLLIGFLLPFSAKVLYLSALSEAREGVQQAIAYADAKLEQAEKRVGEDSLASARGWLASFDRSHKQVPALWVLIGGSKGWLYLAMTLAIVAYNAIRAILTMKVSALRDGEESSHIAPALASYIGKYKLHLVASVIYWISIASFFWNTGHWLWTTRVWVAA